VSSRRFDQLFVGRRGRTKDGEDRASSVEPIFGDLIKSLHMKSAHQTAGEDVGRGAGYGERKPIFEVKQRF
jgi:hypothetical protein